MEPSMLSKDWAESLVDRDWEIYWSIAQDDADSAEEGDDEDVEDWYDGHVRSVEDCGNGRFSFKILFVGDDEIYTMELEPSQVRPSASAWIRRTRAILGNQKGDPKSQWFDNLPPDTSTLANTPALEKLKEEVNSQGFSEPVVFPRDQESTPTETERSNILALQLALRSQNHLRTSLGNIVNHHGSSKFVDGEPNPTEPLVNHLVQCCSGLDVTCRWYLRCWELLGKCFGQRSGQPSNESHMKERSLNYDLILREYLEFGRDCLVACASADIDTPNAKRRQVPVSPSSSPRRRKRRRKTGLASDDEVRIDPDGDMRSSEFVDQFLEQLQDSTSGWFYPVFGSMLRYISHNIFDPLVRWRVLANRLLGTTDDDEAMKGLGESKMETDEGDDKSNASMDSEDVQWCCYEDIDACLKTLEQNPVLEFLDAAKEETSLRNKLTEISRIAAEGREMFQRLGENNVTSVPQEVDFGDKLLKHLMALMDSLELPDNALNNVDPIGQAEAAWTRSHLRGAICFRNWVSSIDHINTTRERRGYVEAVREKAASILEELQGIPCFDVTQISSKQKEALTSVEKLVGDTERLNALEQNAEHLLALDGGFSMTEAQDCLEKLRESPVVLLPEERLAVRVDMMKWSKSADTVLSSGARVSFEQLEKIHQDLQQVKLGVSATRSSMVDGLRRDEELENKIQVFASEDLSRVVGHISDKTETLFHSSMQWKVKAEGIIYTLRLHGNVSAGDPAQSQKVPSMVDIKRVHELVNEYATMKVDFPDLMATLVRILEDAEGWSNGLAKKLSKEESTLRDNWSTVEAERLSRPKGLIMHPTRQVTDALVDLFVWYDRVQASLSALNNPLDDTIVTSLYHLLAEGMTVVQLFSQNTSAGYELKIKETTERLEASHGIRPTARAVNIEKIQGYVPGLTFVHKMATDTFDAREGFPLASLLWVDWHLNIAHVVSSCLSSDTGRDEKKTKQTPGRSLSLKDAISIRSSMPCRKVDLNEIDQPQPWNHATATTRELDTAIQAAELLETEIRDTIASQREFRKGVAQKSDAVREHLAGLKELLAALKERASNIHYLSIDPTLEGPLEGQIKMFSWMTRTLSFPFLYLDEASYSNIGEGELTRIPWDALVTLYDRMPVDDDDLKVDDFALVTMRIKELFTAARKWQDEISRNTSLSNRGGKRRAPNLGSQGSQEEEATTSNVQIELMEKLAADPVLLKVAMPREDAMHRVLRSSTEFETKLQKIFGEDFSVQTPDRAAYPDSDSLVGKNGDFVLFRLTGSALFQAMLPDMYELAEVAEGVLAETSGKHTFDWLKRSVDWIDDLNSCVAKESPFVDCRKKLLVIPCADARRLVELGNDLFLSIAEDVKQTFSSHGIFVTTNKQGKSFRVAVKKSGAHHSMGGTIVRWCPILYECLKADVTRLEEWELELTQLLSEFNKFFQNKGSHTKPTDDDLYRWHCFKERTSTLLEEGAQTLVVAPEANFVSSFTNLLKSQESFLAQHSSPQLHQVFAKRWFSEGTSQLNDREDLLDSLMARREHAEDRKPTKDVLDEDESSFRQICRTYVSSSLGRVARVAGLGKARDIDSLCAFKAWEIECEMFDEFQQELGLTKVSDEYKNKARSLRVSLDDRNNLSLGLQILTGELNVSNVIKMSKEQLASHKTKNARAKAEKDALIASNLTPRLRVSPQEGATPSEPVSSCSGAEPTIETAEHMDPVKRGLSSILRRSKLSTTPGTATVGAPAIADSPKEISKEEVVKAEASTALKTMTKLAAKATTAPPPPPSLATSFSQNQNKAASSSQLRIENGSGSDSFKFDILNLRLTFSAALYLEANGHENIRRFLPSCLKERGRLGDKEFSRFISSKLEGGKWAAISLRLVTLSDDDHDAYKRFYQDYEGKRRIAMLGVNSETKVFLVTPRYHNAAKKAGVVSLGNKSSTYAVVLTKDIRLVQE